MLLELDLHAELDDTGVEGLRRLAEVRDRQVGVRQAQLRLDVYNALDTLNLFLPNADLSVSNFGKSTQAFDARVIQLGVKFQF